MRRGTDSHVAIFIGASLLAACGGSSAAKDVDAGSSTDAETATTDSATDAGKDAADGGTTNADGGPSLAQRTQAVTDTTMTDPLCTKLGDFYWEIGDATGTLGSGAIGTTYAATTSISIASASKFVFGAYMVQSTAGQLTAPEEQELRMLSGYYGLDPTACAASVTVSDCLSAGKPGPNYSYDASYVGSFYYGGAHDEHFAATPVADGGLGLGADTTDDLNALIMPVIKNPGFRYAFPEFAGGIVSTPAQFATFLQSIVADQLLLHDYLGVNAVCTLPGTCAMAIASPIPLNWHYSYNHWVEDDPTSDGAFSSAGAFGFYPWITADKQLYGVLARKEASSGNGDGDGTGPGYDSAACGLKMRAAWNTGQTQ